MREAVVAILASIAQVEAVSVVEAGKVVQVFTVIADEDDSAYDVIYEREREIIRRFGDTAFDFNVIVRRDRPLPQIISLNSSTWHREAAV
jgi:hypothetical protein